MDCHTRNQAQQQWYYSPFLCNSPSHFDLTKGRDSIDTSPPFIYYSSDLSFTFPLRIRTGFASEGFWVSWAGWPRQAFFHRRSLPKDQQRHSKFEIIWWELCSETTNIITRWDFDGLPVGHVPIFTRENQRQIFEHQHSEHSHQAHKSEVIISLLSYCKTQWRSQLLLSPSLSTLCLIYLRLISSTALARWSPKKASLTTLRKTTWDHLHEIVIQGRRNA